MRRYQSIAKLLLAVTMLFVASTANAQIGGLLKKAKKAVKDKVGAEAAPAASSDGATNATTNSSGLEVAPPGWRYHGGKIHKFVPNDTKEVLKFLEVDKTPEQQKVYSYYDLQSSATVNAPAKSDYQAVAQDLIRVLWDLHDVEGSLGGKNPEGWIRSMDGELAEKINRAAAYGTEPAEIADLFDVELLRVKALFHDKYFPGESKLVGADNSAWIAERQASRAAFKYALNDLKDVGPNAKKYKPGFEAKVKAELNPTRILSVYLISGFWCGLYRPDYPEYKDYGNVQEIPLKAFYVKNGKYYVVKGGYRQCYLTSDPGQSTKPIANYNPGLQEPVEIPADIAKKYFK